MERFIRCGAAAAPVQSIAEIIADAHIQARNNLVSIRDDELDSVVTFQNVVGNLSATPRRVRSAGPRFGEHNGEILMGELGFTPEELSDPECSRTRAEEAGSPVMP